MSWGTFVLAAVGIATLGILLIALIGFVGTEILDPDAGRQFDHEEDPDRIA